MNPLLTTQNYKNGFLIDQEVIAGVTELTGPVYAAYMAHYLTGEILEYQEFSSLKAALDYINTVNRSWIYESIGCSKKTAKTTTASSSGSFDTGCGSGCSCL